MLTDKVKKALQERIKVEQDSAQIYFALSEWCDFNGYYGTAKLFKVYAHDENKDAREVCDYLQDNDVMPEIPALDKPNVEGLDLLQSVAKKGLEREQFVTESYKELAKVANEEGDTKTYVFALDVIENQIDEESKMLKFIDRLSVAPDYIVDKENKKLAK